MTQWTDILFLRNQSRAGRSRLVRFASAFARRSLSSDINPAREHAVRKALNSAHVKGGGDATQNVPTTFSVGTDMEEHYLEFLPLRVVSVGGKWQAAL